MTPDRGGVVSTGPTLTSWHSPVSTIQPGLQWGLRTEPLCVGWGVREGTWTPEQGPQSSVGRALRGGLLQGNSCPWLALTYSPPKGTHI